MRKFFMILIASCMTSFAVLAQTSSVAMNVEVKKNSTLAINGTTNVVNFRLFQSSNNFIRKNLFVTAFQSKNKLFLSESQLTVPVKSFNSSNKMALRDFYKLLKSDEYPTMQIQLQYIELPTSKSQTAGNAIVDVTITGVTKKYSFPIVAVKTGNDYIFKMNKDINIRDFGLKPPVQMMGMLKVNEMININMNMVCNIQPVESASR
ncbi:MAG: YceI family protein [Paludibacteraceae bacterium]